MNCKLGPVALVFVMQFLACSPMVRAQTGIVATLPNGRVIHPAGNWIPLAPYPFALAVRPDGDQIATPSIGFPFALNVINGPASRVPSMMRSPGGEKDDPAIEVHAGLVYSHDGSLLYVATGDSGKVRAYRTSNWKTTGEVSLDSPFGGKQSNGSFAATLTISADGTTLYVLDQGNWRVVIVDAASLGLLAEIPTGSYPFGLALSPDGDRLYVTNSGLFEYQRIPGGDSNHPLGTGLHFPPFGYPSGPARDGTVAEGMQVPGLGDENSVRGSSLWTYDVRDREHPAIAAKLRLGTPISEDASSPVGGAAPIGVAANRDAVYVSLAHEDAVVKVSADGSRVLNEIQLSPFKGTRFQDSAGRPLRGVMPSGLALGYGRLYVAESGIDAVGVIDTAADNVIEHIPVGWNPSSLALSPDGATLYVVNTKGRGTGPNAGMKHDPHAPTYVGSLELGSLSSILLSSLEPPEMLTQSVIDGNTAAIAKEANPPHRIQHCFLVIRENRTFDEILGDVKGVNGDLTLARYGLEGWTQEDHAASHLKVTPNLHALAQQFAISDNYYVDSDVSADGHRWVMGIDPTPFFNTAWTSDHRRHGGPDAPQPGRRAMFGGADAPMPEDEPEFGSLWEHVAASGKEILNYGEGLEIEGNKELEGSEPEGQRLFLNSPLPLPVFEHTDRRYPTFNLGIPDQFRAAEFEQDFRVRLAKGNIPALIVIRLPNDHTAKPRPADGYRYRASYVADNDLALGRIVAFLSQTSVWKDSAMFVTEDDAQGGVDHVDAHRSVLLIVSPWVVPGSISHQHTSMGSITRTIDELLGLGPLNLEDALAGEVTGIFDTKLHSEPFKIQPSDPRVFNPAKARFAKPKTDLERAELHDVDDAQEIREEMEKVAGTLSRPARNK
jgi:YVTN family beta-propeller protein